MNSRDLATLICVLLLGCNGSSRQAVHADSNGAGTDKLSSTAVQSSVDSPTHPTSPCPRTGRWALCSVEKRLEQSGFVVRRVAGIPSGRPGFSVTPAIYTLGGRRLEVFIYPDEATLSRDVAKLDTVTVTPRGSASSWQARTTPTFVRSANLAAVFLSDNALQVERLTLALTAGAPQP
jgi:hypothetical protein